MFAGIHLVTSRDTREPATEQAKRLLERMLQVRPAENTTLPVSQIRGSECLNSEIRGSDVASVRVSEIRGQSA